MDGKNHAAPPGLVDLFAYPFMSCLVERRTRRIARGTSVEAGPLSHHSTNTPQPLSKLEEAVLIVCTGATGLTTHDGPLVKPNGGQARPVFCANAFSQPARWRACSTFFLTNP